MAQWVKDPVLSLQQLGPTAVVGVQSLAQELLHITGVAKKKKKKRQRQQQKQ